MDNLILTFIIVLAQLGDLSSPTPWASPTPQPGIDIMIDDAADLVATAQADDMDYRADGNQVYYDNAPLLPNLETNNSALLFGYAKWLYSNGSRSLLGVFHPLVYSLSLLLVLGFISLTIYFWENLVVTILILARAIVNFVMRLFGR